MRKTLEGRPVRLVRLMLRTWVLLDIRSGMEVCIRPEIIWFLNFLPSLDLITYCEGLLSSPDASPPSPVPTGPKS